MCASNAQQGPFSAREAGGQHLAHVTPPEAQRGCCVAQCYRAAGLLVPREQAVPGNLLEPMSVPLAR